MDSRDRAILGRIVGTAEGRGGFEETALDLCAVGQTEERVCADREGLGFRRTIQRVEATSLAGVGDRRHDLREPRLHLTPGQLAVPVRGIRMGQPLLVDAAQAPGQEIQGVLDGVARRLGQHGEEPAREVTKTRRRDHRQMRLLPKNRAETGYGPLQRLKELRKTLSRLVDDLLEDVEPAAQSGLANGIWRGLLHHLRVEAEEDLECLAGALVGEVAGQVSRRPPVQLVEGLGPADIAVVDLA